MLQHDGLYLSHGPDRHALVVIRQDNGKTLFIRDFETVDAALNILDEIDVMPNQNLADIREALVGKKGFFSNELAEPEDGYASCNFRRYVLSQHENY